VPRKDLKPPPKFLVRTPDSTSAELAAEDAPPALPGTQPDLKETQPDLKETQPDLKETQPDFSHLAAPIFASISEVLPGLTESVLDEMAAVNGPITPIRLLLILSRHAPAFCTAIMGVIKENC